ncbi:hypothetical protein BMT54_03440 [Pasteurellaceae bacterium 15-036681]|nr:hypothetical protein BMT54_03440 [Pasteurellaceae bacterium 15-036681]
MEFLIGAVVIFFVCLIMRNRARKGRILRARAYTYLAVFYSTNDRLLAQREADKIDDQYALANYSLFLRQTDYIYGSDRKLMEAAYMNGFIDNVY